MGQMTRGEKYLEKWHKYSRSEEALEVREEHHDLFADLAEFLEEQINLGTVDREMVVNMCAGIIIRNVALLGRCPACEFFDSSVQIHEELGCPEVQ
jgi:hypothetical protein